MFDAIFFSAVKRLILIEYDGVKIVHCGCLLYFSSVFSVDLTG